MSSLPAPSETTTAPWQVRVERIQAFLNRVPWLLPALSFAIGWIGFLMIRRGAAAARPIAILALVGWPWLLIEPLIRRGIGKWKPRMGVFVVNFVSQSLQQELLFFTLPLVIGATQFEAGQLVFASFAAIMALVSTIDPLYERIVAKRAVTRLAFHAYCSWIAALVVFPMVLRLPLERTLPVSLAAVGIWLLVTMPFSLGSLRSQWLKLGWIVGIFAVPVGLWLLREHVPAAGLAVTDARISQTIQSLTPGPAVKVLAPVDLSRGVVAFVAIRAPSGLAQSVIFEWRHGRESERIVEEIRGGNQIGWRTYSRKQKFPTDSSGKWTVHVLTPQGQLLKRLRFEVSNSITTQASP